MNRTEHSLQPKRRLRRLSALAAVPAVLCGLSAAVPFATAAPVAAAPDSAALSSRLTGVRLPAGGERITDKGVAATGKAQIQRVADGGGLTLGQTEHFGWRGEGHNAAKNEALVKQAVTSLEAAGYTYKVAAKKDIPGGGTLTYFLAMHPKKGQALLGCWVAGDAFLMLNWGEVSKETKPGDGDEPSADGGASTRSGAQESGAPTS